MQLRECSIFYRWVRQPEGTASVKCWPESRELPHDANRGFLRSVHETGPVADARVEKVDAQGSSHDPEDC